MIFEKGFKKTAGAFRNQNAQGIEVEILLAKPKDWNGKPGPALRPDAPKFLICRVNYRAGCRKPAFPDKLTSL
jgi:hypothetical protein